MDTQQEISLLEKEVGSLLFTEAEIKAKVEELGRTITQDFKHIATTEKPLIIVGVLKGVLIFLADLMRELDLPVELYFVDVSSGGNQVGGRRYSELSTRMGEAIQARHVLFVEDIVDEGLTLSYITRMLWQKNPTSVSVCTLLSKEAKRIMDIDIRYIGFHIDPVYVIGYGLDYKEQFRNLRYISVLKADEE